MIETTIRGMAEKTGFASRGQWVTERRYMEAMNITHRRTLQRLRTRQKIGLPCPGGGQYPTWRKIGGMIRYWLESPCSHSDTTRAVDAAK